MKRGIFSIFRRRGCVIFKTFAFVGFCWLLIVFGYYKKSSELSEVADRRNFMRLEDVEEKTLIENSENLNENPGKLRERHENMRENQDFKEINEPARKVEVINADFDDIKDDLMEKIEKASNVGNFENVVQENEENLWIFQEPPNIFKNKSVGENGIAWKLPAQLPPDIQKLVTEGWQNHQFNEYLSNLISVRRNLPDFRSEYCKNAEKNYVKDLPTTSVIM